MPKEKPNHRKKKESTPAEVRAKDFIDMTVPGILKFNPDHYICGSTYRCVWALREYPTTTDEKALLRHLGEKGNVILHVYSRAVSPVEERKIIQNAANKHKMDSASTSDISQSIGAEANLRDVAALVQTLRDNREPLLHCAVFIELIAKDMEELKLLQTEVYAEMTRSKLNVDKLLLRQQQGFLSVMPGGANRFGEQFERALPASSVANLYPFNYSGKTDSHGFYIGRDKFGSNIIVDLDKREAELKKLPNYKEIYTIFQDLRNCLVTMDYVTREYFDTEATIDGTPLDHFRADYLLRAAILPAGNHQIVFQVITPDLKRNQTIMLISVLLILVALISSPLLSAFYELRSFPPPGKA